MTEAEIQIETAAPVEAAVETPQPLQAVPELKLTRHQLRIQRLQEKLKARLSGEELKEPKPVTYVSGLEQTTVELLMKCKSGSVPFEAMVEPLAAGLRYLGNIITSTTTTESDKLRSATTIAWLAAASLRAEIGLSNVEVKKAQASQRTKYHEARREKHAAARVGVVLEIAAERRKIDKQLRRAAREQEAAAEIAKLEQAIREAPDRFSRLLAKQALVKFKQELRKRGK